MRRLLCLGLCLAVVAFGVRAEEAAQNAEVDLADAFEELDESVKLDLARMLQDIFEIDEDEDAQAEGVVAEGSNREDRARDDVGDSDKAMSDPKDLSRFNGFIDTFFRRLNAYSRSRFDPLGFAIAKKGGGDKGKKGDGEKNKKKGGKGEKKGGNKKGGNKKGGNKKGGNKKGNRHPKDLNLDEEEEVAEETVEIREKREVDLVAVEEVEDVEDVDETEEEEQESLDRVKRDADAVPAEEGEAVARKGRPAGGAKKGNKNKSAKKSNKNKKNKKGKKGGKKKNSKKGGKKGRKSSKARTTRAFVTGLATLARSGDVIVRNSENNKLIKANFRMGPIDLKVSRKFGKGKDAVTRNARAGSPQLEGRIAIKISPNGRAKVSAFKVKKPAIVKVDGNLSRADKDSTNNNFMENSIGKFAPYAAQKLKLASRAVLKEAEPKKSE
ncbi:uncharacterized protein [Penaeus vannamei]|uniref:uncharacterized protein n=1 Tax=Penaeus vannamei TaxID=6689 RepID=UPI00387F4783